LSISGIGACHRTGLDGGEVAIGAIVGGIIVGIDMMYGVCYVGTQMKVLI
jgi:hypothetical protein